MNPRVSEIAARTYLDLAEVLFIASDPEGRVLYVNRKGCEVLGYPEAEIRGKLWIDHFVPERLRVDLTRVFRDVMAGDITPFEYHENPITTRSGEERLIAWHNALLRDDKGAILAMLSSGSDVTERARAEEALRRSEESLSATLQSIGDAVIATDTEGRVVRMNPGAERLTGYSLDEARGRPLEQVLRLIDEESRKYVESPATRVLREGLEAELAHYSTLISKSGYERPIADRGAPIRGARGDLQGVVLVLRDMTEERDAAMALQRSESTLRAFYDSAPYIMGLCELGEDDIRIISCNAAMAAFHERPLSEIIGRTLGELGTPAASRAFLVGKYREAQREGRPIRFQYRREGEAAPRTLQVAVSPLPETPEGEPLFSVVTEDVTERDRMQARLLLSDRMASLGTLAAGVAHEINNPLSYVVTNLDILSSYLAKSAGGGESDASHALAQARQGVERVRQIVKGLWTFSRGDDEKRERLRLEDVLETSINIVWNEIRHRAVLVREYGGAPAVVANQAHLGQLFLNLLINAAHAIAEGRASSNTIRVVTRADADGRAVVEVIDTGSGISPSIIDRIFDPFFTTRAVGEGLGLGLSVCHGIVKALGGEIAVESEVGRGSTFRVTLAAAPAETRRPPPPTSVPAEPKRARILIVDDEPLLRMSLRALLSGDHEVIATASGREVLAKLGAGERFDVLLCDLMMPEMTGMDLYDRLRQEAPDQADRMVFLTGGVFTARAQNFLDRVPNPCVEKPFDIGELRAVIEKMLG